MESCSPGDGDTYLAMGSGEWIPSVAFLACAAFVLPLKLNFLILSPHLQEEECMRGCGELMADVKPQQDVDEKTQEMSIRHSKTI